MATQKQAMASVGELEKLAKKHMDTAAMLKKLAKGLYGVIAEVEAAGAGLEAPKRVKRLPARKKGPSIVKVEAEPKKRKLSAAARKNLSRKMKALWQERKAAA